MLSLAELCSLSAAARKRPRADSDTLTWNPKRLRSWRGLVRCGGWGHLAHVTLEWLGGDGEYNVPPHVHRLTPSPGLRGTASFGPPGLRNQVSRGSSSSHRRARDFPRWRVVNAGRTARLKPSRARLEGLVRAVRFVLAGRDDCAEDSCTQQTRGGAGEVDRQEQVVGELGELASVDTSGVVTHSELLGGMGFGTAVEGELNPQDGAREDAEDAAEVEVGVPCAAIALPGGGGVAALPHHVLT